METGDSLRGRLARVRALVLAVLTTVAVSQVSARAPATLGQPMFRGGAALTGLFGGPAPRRLTGVRFTFNAGAPLRNAPTVAGGRAYLGAANGRFYALDVRSGEPIWQVSVGSAVTSSAAIVGDAAIFSTRNDIVFALSARDGRRLWSTPLGADLGKQNYWDFYTSSPTLFQHKIYIGSGDGHVYAIEPRHGRILWRAEIGARVRSTPAVTNELVVVGAQDGKVYGLDRATGLKRWVFATDGASYDFQRRHNDTTSVFASPTIANGVVAIGGRDGQLYGLDLATGRQRWKTTQDNASWILSTAAADGVVYVGGGSARLLQAQDITTGAERWRFATTGAVFGSFALVGDVLVFTDLSGCVRALDRTNGHELWSFRLGDRSFSTTVVVDGIVYASADDGVLYALETAETPAPQVIHRYVYHAATPADGPTWFSNGIDIGAQRFFRDRGYDAVTTTQLQQVMNEQITKGGRSVVVFADNYMPPALTEGHNETAMIRRYLDAGGAVVFLSNNPVAFRYDANGAPTGVDEAIAESILSLHYPPHPIDYGYHVSHATEAGAHWGLTDYYVISGVITEDQVTTVLGRDEFNMPTTWVKHYGKHGLLLQLSAPINRAIDLTRIANAVEFAVASSAGS